MGSQNSRPQIMAPGRSSFMKRHAWMLLLALITTACTQNAPYRTAEAVRCERDDCDPGTYIEQHQDYDLAFVEFSERGNVFSRERMNQVLDFVGKRAQHDPGQPGQGVDSGLRARVEAQRQRRGRERRELPQATLQGRHALQERQTPRGRQDDSASTSDRGLCRLARAFDRLGGAAHQHLVLGT